MTEALKEQQRIDLERSFDYARKKLDVASTGGLRRCSSSTPCRSRFVSAS